MHGGEWDATEKDKPPTGARRQELVFIGPGLKTAELEAELDKCLLTDAEMEQKHADGGGSTQAAEDRDQYALGHAHGHGDGRSTRTAAAGGEEQKAKDQSHDHDGHTHGSAAESPATDAAGGPAPSQWWRALKDNFPAYDVDCCITDTECEEHLPRGAPKLRFKPGDRVQCFYGDHWATGTITMLFYREDDWPRGQYAPYQVRLDSGDMICAPADVDDCIKAAKGALGGSIPPPRKPPALRFKPGDRVMCRVSSDGWAAGTVTLLHYREDDWPPGEFHPYQIKLDGGRMICAPADVDQCIKQEPAAAAGAKHAGTGKDKRSSRRAKGVPEVSKTA